MIKQWFRNLSIARKLIAIAVATTTVSVAVACAAILAYDISSSRERVARDTGPLADVVDAHSTAALASGDAPTASEPLASVRANPHTVSALILSQAGTPFAQYRRVRLN